MMSSRQLTHGLLILVVLGCATAFTPVSTRTCQFQSTKLTTFQQPTAGSTPCSVSRSKGMALFRKPQNDGNTNSNNPLVRLKKLLTSRAWFTAFARVQNKLQRAAMILMASAMIWFGTLPGSDVPPASAAPSSSVAERVLPKSNGQIIDRYVKQHMFDDDDANPKDPLEAAYREAYEDYKTTGAYPNALKEITTEVLGQGAGKQLIRQDDDSSLGFFGVIKGCMRFLERRGLSETTALTVVGATLVIVLPTSLLFFGMFLGGISKRNMQKLMKKRYGETYTLDATIKEEPDVDAPDDDEDDDDEDDDEDDDDDDDE